MPLSSAYLRLYLKDQKDVESRVASKVALAAPACNTQHTALMALLSCIVLSDPFPYVQNHALSPKLLLP